jgi:hypothetical protein
MGRFKEFDFEHPSFRDGNPRMKEVLLEFYKSQRSCSEFIAAVQKDDLAAKASRGKQWNRTQYRNAHKISEQYQKLDAKFNFFGHYKD